MKVIYYSYAYHPSVHDWTERKFGHWYTSEAWYSTQAHYLSPSEGEWLVPGTFETLP
jgi:hypothetical protein